MKVYNANLTSQQKNKKHRNRTQLINSNPTSMVKAANIIAADPVKFVLTYIWTPEGQRILNAFIRYFNLYGHLKVNPSVAVIARDAKVATSTVENWTLAFEALGIISHTNEFNYAKMRYYANTYKLNPVFLIDKIREQLSSILYCFKYFPVAMLLVASLSNTASDQSIVKSKGILSFKGSILLKDNSSIQDTRTRETPKMNSKLQTEAARLKLIENHSITVKNSYEYLQPLGQFIAVLCGMSPSSAAYLAPVEPDILHEAVKLYFLAQSKQQVQCKAKLFGSILQKVLDKHKIVIDYSLVTSIIHQFGLNRNWDKLSPMEHSHFLRQVANTGRELELEVKSTYAKSFGGLGSEVIKLAPQREEFKAAKEKAEADAKLKRLRSIPGNPLYTGDAPVLPQSIKTRSKILENIEARRSSSLEANSSFVDDSSMHNSELTTTNTPQAPLANSGGSGLIGAGSTADIPENLNEMLEFAMRCKLKENHEQSIEETKSFAVRQFYDDPEGVDNFKDYVTRSLPNAIAMAKGAGCYKEATFRDMFDKKRSTLSQHDRVKLQSEGFDIDFHG